MNSSFEIRNLNETEIPLIVNMAAAEGWNPGLKDSDAFYQADQRGFFVGLLDAEPIAFISAVNYNNQYGFVGLYIVKPEHRGKGYGYAIWQHAMNALGNLPCGLDGVPAQVENYRKSGFVYAFRQMRMAGKALSPSEVSDHIFTFDGRSTHRINEYDREVFGTGREAFLNAWLSMPNAKVFYSEDKNGTIDGYAVIRKCGDGYKIGPLFADNPQVAEQLFRACHSVAEPGETVYIDIPEPHGPACEMARRYRLELVFETARMYKNGAPHFPLEKVFGITTFELG